MLRLKLESAIAANDEIQTMILDIEFLERLIIVAREMEQAWIWDIDTYCLCHRDLEPRNILVGNKQGNKASPAS